jgi:multimeric flavodoxin WrbA
MKKVLGLISSPRKKGNSEIMTKEIMCHIGGDRQLEILQLLDLHIEPCKGCYSCMKPGRKCPRDDDMEFFFRKIAEAEGIILSSPVYNWGINIGIRRIFDRAFLFKYWKDKFENKPCVTFVTYGVPYEEGYALMVLNELVRQLNLRLKESAAFWGALPGDVLKYRKNLKMAKQMGKALSDPLYRRKQRENECPNCFSNMIKFRSETDLPVPGLRPVSQVECAFCGTVAEIGTTGKGFGVSYHGKGLYDEAFPKRLSEWHEDSIRSFTRDRKEIEKEWIKKYDHLNIKQIIPPSKKC